MRLTTSTAHRQVTNDRVYLLALCGLRLELKLDQDSFDFGAVDRPVTADPPQISGEVAGGPDQEREQ